MRTQHAARNPLVSHTSPAPIMAISAQQARALPTALPGKPNFAGPTWPVGCLQSPDQMSFRPTVAPVWVAGLGGPKRVPKGHQT